MKRIVHISDTHNKHEEIIIPSCDIVVHSGDATNSGSINEIISFINWFGNLDVKTKIFVPGNHDICVEKDFNVIGKMCRERNITCGVGTHLSLITDEGKVLFGFFPWVLPIGRWSFMKTEEEQERLLNLYQGIDCDVFISHSPPKGINDSVSYYDILKGCQSEYNLGSNAIFNHIMQSNIYLSLFGHVHECGGSSTRFNDVLFINSATKLSVIDIDIKNRLANII